MKQFAIAFAQGTYEDHPIAALFPLMGDAELEELVLSMRTHGYDRRHPIVLSEGKILDGRNRYRAAKAADVTPSFVTWEEGDPWDLVWRENATRRQLEPGQKAALHLEFVAGSKSWQEERAKRAAAANASRSVAVEASHARRNIPPTMDGRAPRGAPPSSKTVKRESARLASAAGVRPRTMERAIELRKMDPQAFARVARGEVPLNRALAETKKAAVVEQIKSKPKPLPGGRHDVIVIDPPWRYDTRGEDRDVRGTVGYPDMSVEEICAMPIASLAEKDCVLWLWTTNAFMREALRCLAAWGFTEKTILTWDKERIGVGHWLRNVTEHCILAVRGKPVVELKNQSTMLRAPRREHSRKPDEFYTLVESLCPGSKLDIFARSERRGWTAWGAEKEKFNAG